MELEGKGNRGAVQLVYPSGLGAVKALTGLFHTRSVLKHPVGITIQAVIPFEGVTSQMSVFKRVSEAIAL